ncbi:hypothetical protein M422DRAFT_24235 [Sphaerobolus stellatus SS14]|nr:hypothetical protein M422DRAFT_24235 [Sphaerobolus stellatus SS14]
MATQHTQGIQTLLEAEKEASKVVQQARQYRVQRLKDARSEATKEVEKYKQQKDEDFKAFESKHAGSTENLQTQVDKETDVKLKAIREQYESRKEDVVQKLLDRVVLVQPELHRNLKKVGA